MTGWCTDCEKEVEVVQMDVGIGPYEFWGSPGVHHQWVVACKECEGDNVFDAPPDEDGQPITMESFDDPGSDPLEDY